MIGDSGQRPARPLIRFPVQQILVHVSDDLCTQVALRQRHSLASLRRSHGGSTPKSHYALLIPLMLALVPTAAQAQLSSFLGPIPKLAFDQGWYAGASLGFSGVSYAQNSLPITGASSSTLSTNDTQDDGFKFYAGYRLLRNFALEGGYTDFGRFSATRNLTPPPEGSLRSNIKLSGVHFDVVGMVPLKKWFELFGKVGVVVTTEKADMSKTGAVQSAGNSHTRRSEFNPKIGFGGDIRIWRALGLRIEDEWVGNVGARSVGEGDIELYSVGIHYHF